MKVGGFGKLAAQGTQRGENQTLALTELRHTQGVSSVSELEEEGGRYGERQEEEERERDRNRQASREGNKSILSTVPNFYLNVIFTN